MLPPVLLSHPGGWRLWLRFRRTGDREADWTWIGQCLPWFAALETADKIELGETLCEYGIACLSCSGPEEAAAWLAGIRYNRIQATVEEPEGSRFLLAGAGLTERQRQRTFGVYPTPRALTRFLVRGVDELLRSRLGLAGLHDPEVRLLDPAAGPLNFVLEAYRRALARWRLERGRKGWEGLFQEHLIPHFKGIEILPESWAGGLREARRLFHRLGVSKGTDRVPFFLADALAGADGRADGFLGEQAAAVARLYAGGTVNVVLGNPPFGTRNGRQGWTTELMRGYSLPGGRNVSGYLAYRGAPLGERNLKWLADDYVRFLRLAQYLIDRTGRGVAALVVNHNCLEAATFRGVRESLLRSFDEIFALDLHGNVRKRETSPSGGPDENVFEGVAQGTAVLFLVKGSPARRAFRGDLYGRRREKLRVLAGAALESLLWREISPRPPGHLFGVAKTGHSAGEGMPLPEIFPLHSLGVVTGNDAQVLAFRREDFEARLAAEGRPELRREVTPLLVRPFDLRQALYTPPLVARPRRAVMSHLLRHRNLALLATRQSPGESGVFVTRWPAGHKVVHAYSPNSVFPLWRIDEEGETSANLSPRFVEPIGELLGEALSPEDAFGYVYAALHHRRLAGCEGARESFPRIPLPRSREGFRRLAALGRELVGIHLLEDPRLAASGIQVEMDGGQRGGPCVVANSGALRLVLNGVSFLGLTPSVWDYKIGSYRVLERWTQARTRFAWDLRSIREFRWIAEAIRLNLDLLTVLEEEESPSHAS